MARNELRPSSSSAPPRGTGYTYVTKKNRRFDPNIQVRRYWLPSKGRTVRLTLGTEAVKTIDRIGSEKAITIIRARGEKA